MRPYYSNGVATLYHANALDLSFLPAERVHCVVTSPPYWGLRQYSLGANGIGLETTPEEYIERLVLVFRQIRRVLRSDGVLWLNMGDSYYSDFGGYHPGISTGNAEAIKEHGRNHKPKHHTLKPLDLIGIPHRMAFALQADGWYLRSEIIWVKGREHEDGTLGLNPMPESMTGWKWQRCKVKIGVMSDTTRVQDNNIGSFDVRSGGRGPLPKWADCPGCETCLPNDGLVLRKGAWRPTDAFEYIFMLTKSPVYFCDQEAVRVPHADVSIARYMMKHGPSGHSIQKWDADGMPTWVAGANPRNLWVFPSEPTKEKHYATFPRELPRRCIMASTSEHGVCGKCGSQYAPVVEANYELLQKTNNTTKHSAVSGWDLAIWPRMRTNNKILGYRPTCACNAPRDQAVVLDPFCGSGTTLMAAQELGRQSIGIDLSEPYLQIARHRIEGLSLPMDISIGRAHDGTEP